MDSKDEGAVVELAMLAGHILLDNGAEIFRVEEVIQRICDHYQVTSVNEFVLSNGIFITVGSSVEPAFARVEHIPVSGTHLDKVAAIDRLADEIDMGLYTVEEATAKAEEIRRRPEVSRMLRCLASGLGSAAFCCLFGGDLADSACAFGAGFILYLFMLYVSGPHLSKIVGNLIGSLLVTLICAFFYLFVPGRHMNFMIIGSIMPLVPGVAFVNAIRDIADGDYISGAVRMLDAMLIFVCIAIGVGFGIDIISRLSGGALL